MPRRSVANAAGAQAVRLAGAAVGLTAVASANVLLAAQVAREDARTAVVIAVAPAALILAAVLVARGPEMLLYVALAFMAIGGPLTAPVALPGGVLAYPTDLAVGLAVSVWAARWLIGAAAGEKSLPQTPVLGWPLALFAVPLLVALARGHEKYGVPYLSPPVRLVLYAGIAVALADLRPKRLLRALTLILYLGGLWGAAEGAVRIATASPLGSELSTGGQRYVALSSAAVLASGLILALVNLDRARDGRGCVLHIVMVVVFALAIAASLGRTIFLALALVTPVLLAVLPRLRRATLALLPLLAPAVVAGLVLAASAVPNVGEVFGSRLALDAATDSSVEWRKEAYGLVLQEVKAAPFFGSGFGRTTGRVGDVTVHLDPHNGYVHLLAAGGLVTLVPFVLLLGAFARDAIRRARSADHDGVRLITWALATVGVLAIDVATTPFLTLPKLDLLLWLALLAPATVTARQLDAAVGSVRVERAAKRTTAAGS